jgi:hypothetical protein
MRSVAMARACDGSGSKVSSTCARYTSVKSWHTIHARRAGAGERRRIIRRVLEPARVRSFNQADGELARNTLDGLCTETGSRARWRVPL